MGLDITIKERKEFRCPECGLLITSIDIREEESSGRVWYDFLEPIGYYVPYEKRTKENDWYGKDMELTEEQANQLVYFVHLQKPYNGMNIAYLVEMALMDGYKIIINANW